MNKIYDVLLSFDVGHFSGHRSVGTNPLPLALALIASDGLTKKFANSPVFLPGQSFNLLEKGRRQRDGDDFSSSHGTKYDSV